MRSFFSPDHSAAALLLNRYMRSCFSPDHSATPLDGMTPDEYTTSSRSFRCLLNRYMRPCCSRSFRCCSVLLLLCWMPVLQINTPDHSAAAALLDASTPDEYTTSSRSFRCCPRFLLHHQLQINTPDHSAAGRLNAITPDEYTTNSRSFRCCSIVEPIYAVLFFSRSFCCCSIVEPIYAVLFFSRSFRCWSGPLLLCWMPVLQINTPDHSATPLDGITPDEYTTSSRSIHQIILLLVGSVAALLDASTPDQYTRSFRCSVPLDASTPDQYTRSFRCWSVECNYS